MYGFWSKNPRFFTLKPEYKANYSLMDGNDDFNPIFSLVKTWEISSSNWKKRVPFSIGGCLVESRRFLLEFQGSARKWKLTHQCPETSTNDAQKSREFHPKSQGPRPLLPPLGPRIVRSRNVNNVASETPRNHPPRNFASMSPFVLGVWVRRTTLLSLAAQPLVARMARFMSQMFEPYFNMSFLSVHLGQNCVKKTSVRRNDKMQRRSCNKRRKDW